MEPRNDIDSLLRTGYFTTTRARSPRPPSPPLYGTYVRRASPRRDFETPRSMNRPPPPTCEDEAEALQKEHGSVAASSVDETPSRGDIDQPTIMEEVPEFNPERRFVFVPNPDGPTEPKRPERKPAVSERPAEKPADKSPPPPRRPPKDDDASAGRRYDSKLSADPINGDGPRLERRKSRQDLPRIDTEFPIEPTKGHHRTRSSQYADQPRPDYFTPRNTKRLSTNDDLLSPQVIKHATGGRDKVYYDYSRGQQRPLAPQRSRSNLVGDKRSDETQSRPTQSLSPAGPRRAAVDVEVPRSSTAAYGEGPSDSSRLRGETDRRRERRYSTNRRESPTRGRGSLERREESISSGEHSLKPQAPPSRRRLSTVVHDDRDRDYLGTSDRDRGHGPSSRRSRSRAPTSPLPSPKVSNGSFDFPPPSPRASGTFPPPSPRASNNSFTPARETREAALPYPEDEMHSSFDGLNVRDNARPPRSRSRAPPASSAPSAALPAVAAAAAAMMPVIMPSMPSLEQEASFDRPSPGLPPSDPRASSSQLSQDSSWPPAPFDPARDGLKVNKPSMSYRRYSEDVGRGELPEIPDCPRRKGAIGKADWLALPRCDNFNICPTCYTGVFDKSPFRNDFVPMPFRPADKPIVCDFGSSPWYRIAWLLTIKNGQPDLRLFHQIAQVASLASSQPCPGDKESARVWYSIRDPRKQNTLADFSVCYECCKTIEVLLPNLTGIFVPQQPAAVPSRSYCSMHFHSTRKRFVLYFDALETASDEALATTSAPDLARLAKVIGRISAFAECRQDRPVLDQSWHVMQYLPEFTVCGECFEEVVKPEIEEGVVARNFYMKPQRLKVATCQLYSKRMREIFGRACRRSDPKYLEDKVLERQDVESRIHRRIQDLYRYGALDERGGRELERLHDEWKRWE